MSENTLPLSKRLRLMEEGCSDNPGTMAYMNKPSRATLLEAASVADRLAAIERQARSENTVLIWKRQDSHRCVYREAYDRIVKLIDPPGE